MSHPLQARKLAEQFIAGKYEIVDDLGSGTDGWVFSLKPHSVVKVHQAQHTFQNELEAYRRLRANDVSMIGRFNVPQFISHDADMRALEISFVTPPYLIDFGKCHFDEEIDFTEEAWEIWYARLEELFGDGVSEVVSVRNHLIRRYGIYHDDLSLDNLNFGQSRA